MGTAGMGEATGSTRTALCPGETRGAQGDGTRQMWRPPKLLVVVVFRRGLCR